MMAENELTKIRRNDRSISDDAWIAAFLQKVDYGVFATCKNGQPFTVTRNFAYDPKKHVIYFHGARKGRTFENVGEGTPVSLNASEMGEWIVADRAMNFGVSYKGVVVFGNLTIVDDIDEAKHGLQLLMDKHFPALRPGVDYEAATDNDLKVTAVFRIDIEAWSGKEKVVRRFIYRVKDNSTGAIQLPK
jgi:nitroimidazol reductase NimA-like FMN-containing flavoprotein (pyridoxamine 5'-phosphate oxidase superfamily)